MRRARIVRIEWDIVRDSDMSDERIAEALEYFEGASLGITVTGEPSFTVEDKDGKPE